MTAVLRSSIFALAASAGFLLTHTTPAHAQDQVMAIDLDEYTRNVTEGPCNPGTYSHTLECTTLEEIRAALDALAERITENLIYWDEDWPWVGPFYCDEPMPLPWKYTFDEDAWDTRYSVADSTAKDFVATLADKNKHLLAKNTCGEQAITTAGIEAFLKMEFGVSIDISFDGDTVLYSLSSKDYSSL